MQALDELWREIEDTAVFAGLDPDKFNETHREILAQIVRFLQQPPAAPAQQVASQNGWGKWLPSLMLGRNGNGKRPSPDNPSPPTPIIICGEPGTGKTTFLNVLDIVLRRAFGLPDNIQPLMHKGAYQFAITKRCVSGKPISLLSVKKWAELLHFYTWDRDQHSFCLLYTSPSPRDPE